MVVVNDKSLIDGLRSRGPYACYPRQQLAELAAGRLETLKHENLLLQQRLDQVIRNLIAEMER